MEIDSVAYASPIGNILQDHELIKDIGGTVAAIDAPKAFNPASVSNLRVAHLASIYTKVVKLYALPVDMTPVVDFVREGLKTVFPSTRLYYHGITA